MPTRRPTDGEGGGRAFASIDGLGPWSAGLALFTTGLARESLDSTPVSAPFPDSDGSHRRTPCPLLLSLHPATLLLVLR